MVVFVHEIGIKSSRGPSLGEENKQTEESFATQTFILNLSVLVPACRTKYLFRDQQILCDRKHLQHGTQYPRPAGEHRLPTTVLRRPTQTPPDRAGTPIRSRLLSTGQHLHVTSCSPTYLKATAKS